MKSVTKDYVYHNEVIGARNRGGQKVSIQELINEIAQLESQLKERDYRYCPYCSHKLSHRVDTDSSTNLVCKYALCPRKLKN